MGAAGDCALINGGSAVGTGAGAATARFVRLKIAFDCAAENAGAAARRLGGSAPRGGEDTTLGASAVTGTLATGAGFALERNKFGFASSQPAKPPPAKATASTSHGIGRDGGIVDTGVAGCFGMA